VGDALQQYASHDLILTDFDTAARIIAVYNLADNVDLSANTNDLSDGDVYAAATGIMGVATTAYVPVGAGEHLQADATAGWTGNGDLNVSIGGWFNSAVSAGYIAVGTNAAAQKVQIYLDANGYAVFDVANITGLSSSYVAGAAWNHLALVYNQATSMAYCYVNFKCENQFIATTNLDLQANKSIWVGCIADGTLELAATEADECFVYEAVLTDLELRRIGATSIALPTVLQSVDCSIDAFMKPSVAGAVSQVWCDEVQRDATRVLISGGTRRSTDYYKLLGRL